VCRFWDSLTHLPFSVCPFIWVHFVCVCFLLCISVFLCFARCVFCDVVHIHEPSVYSQYTPMSRCLFVYTQHSLVHWLIFLFHMYPHFSHSWPTLLCRVLQCTTVCCSVLQCVAVCCKKTQRVRNALVSSSHKRSILPHMHQFSTATSSLMRTRNRPPKFGSLKNRANRASSKATGLFLMT